MTRAAAPATSGDDWLVPPKPWIGEPAPLLSVQPRYSVRSGLHSAQPESPGAARSGTRPLPVVPPEDSGVMLSLTQVPLSKFAPARPCCWYERKFVVPATEMMFGSDDGVPIVPVVPASPVPDTTTMPAA